VVGGDSFLVISLTGFMTGDTEGTMFQVAEDSLAKLMEASQQLHGKLVASPLWGMLKDEPLIVNWINALSEIDSQFKKAQAPPNA
jgi:hypothetical protein